MNFFCFKKNSDFNALKNKKSCMRARLGLLFLIYFTVQDHKCKMYVNGREERRGGGGREGSYVKV